MAKGLTTFTLGTPMGPYLIFGSKHPFPLIAEFLLRGMQHGEGK